jgi:hypothetical protein
MSRVDHVPRRATELGVPSRPHLLVFASWSFGGSGVGGGGGVSCGRSSPSSPPTGQGSMVRGQDGESGGVAWCGLALLACVYPSAQSAHPSCESLSTSGTSYVEFSAATSRNVDGGRRRAGGGVGRNTELEERQETSVVARQRGTASRGRELWAGSSLAQTTSEGDEGRPSAIGQRRCGDGGAMGCRGRGPGTA